MVTRKTVQKSPKKTKSSKKLASSSKASTKVHKVMKEFKEGKLHSRSKRGPKVRSRKQAIAIALSEAGASNKKPSKKRSSSKKS